MAFAKTSHARSPTCRRPLARFATQITSLPSPTHQSCSRLLWRAMLPYVRPPHFIQILCHSIRVPILCVRRTGLCYAIRPPNHDPIDTSRTFASYHRRSFACVGQCVQRSHTNRQLASSPFVIADRSFAARPCRLRSPCWLKAVCPPLAGCQRYRYRLQRRHARWSRRHHRQ